MEVQLQTLRYVKNNKNDTLISINVLECAAAIIKYIAALHYYKTCPDDSDPTPTVLLYDDNRASESWRIKGCKSAMIGCGLVRIQCSLMISSPVGLKSVRVTTEDNEIADRISRIMTEADVFLNFKF